jgi:hypothetical protein
MNTIKESTGSNFVIALLKRWGAMRYPWPLWLIPVLLISPAALLIPVDVFVQYPWVETYAHWLAKFIPMIDRAAHLHPHPQQFKAFFAYAWSWLPLCLFLAWFDGQQRAVKEIEARLQSPALFFALLLVLFAIGLLWYAPEGPLFGSNLMSLHDKRAGLYSSTFTWIWFGPFQTYVTAGISVGIFRYIRIVWANRHIYDIGLDQADKSSDK